MKKTAITAAAGAALLAGSVLVAPTGAAAAPSLQASPAASDYMIKVALRSAWRQQSPYSRSMICRGYRSAPSTSVRIISKPMISAGLAPAWQVRPLVRRLLVNKCF